MPQPVHRARRHSGWNNPEGVGEAKPEGYNPILRKVGLIRFVISIELSTISSWKGPHGPKTTRQEPSCKKIQAH